MCAAAVQPLTVQPLALAQPGTDVSAAAEEPADHKYVSVQLEHAGISFYLCSLIYCAVFTFCRFIFLAVGRNCRQ